MCSEYEPILIFFFFWQEKESLAKYTIIFAIQHKILAGIHNIQWKYLCNIQKIIYFRQLGKIELTFDMHFSLIYKDYEFHKCILFFKIPNFAHNKMPMKISDGDGIEKQPTINSHAYVNI